MPRKAYPQITYPFPNFNGYTVEIWERISIFLSHFTMGVLGIWSSMLSFK